MIGNKLSAKQRNHVLSFTIANFSSLCLSCSTQTHGLAAALTKFLVRVLIFFQPMISGLKVLAGKNAFNDSGKTVNKPKITKEEAAMNEAVSNRSVNEMANFSCDKLRMRL